MAKEDRGFASMDRALQLAIASKGGKAAHRKGRAHEWNSDEARAAGRKGGLAAHERRRLREMSRPADASGEQAVSGRGPTATVPTLDGEPADGSNA
jgi:general stress protein YciG